MSVVQESEETDGVGGIGVINKHILQGRLTHTPELRTTQSGVERCNFTVAWSERRGENESQLFLNCTAWRGTAELLGKYFSKGQEIIVEGALVQRKYTGRDGVERTVIEMPSVDKVHFCGPKRDSGSPRADYDAPMDPELEGFTDITDDEDPF